MTRTAIYLRVSSLTQGIESQLPDLIRWCKVEFPAAGIDWPSWFAADTCVGNDDPVCWYRDHASGKTMNRPGFTALEDAIRAGKVNRVVVWRLDRLGRRALGLHQFYEFLGEHNTDFVSLRDGFQLSTAAGRLIAGVLASVAQFELECRRERQAAGLEAARQKSLEIHDCRAKGYSLSTIANMVGLKVPQVRRCLASEPGSLWWGGTSETRLTKISRRQEHQRERIAHLRAQGLKVEDICRVLKISRATYCRRLEAQSPAPSSSPE